MAATAGAVGRDLRQCKFMLGGRGHGGGRPIAGWTQVCHRSRKSDKFVVVSPDLGILGPFPATLPAASSPSPTALVCTTLPSLLAPSVAIAVVVMLSQVETLVEVAVALVPMGLFGIGLGAAQSHLCYPSPLCPRSPPVAQPPC